jgi:putative chitinase
MTNKVCGVNAALDEAKAGINSLKDKISGGLDSIGDLGGLATTIKNKLAEVNVPQLPTINLQAELANLPKLTPEEYAAKVAELKKAFGDAVPNLDNIISKIPKPAGVDGVGQKDIFADLKALAGDVGAAVRKAQEELANLSIDSVVADVCKEVPNVEVVTTTETVKIADPKTGKETKVEVPVTSPPVEKAKPPTTPKENPKKEIPPSEPPAKGFTFNFTREKLIAAGGKEAGPWYDAMVEMLPKYNITTPERVAAFIGNVRAESTWTKLSENLNYGAKYLFERLNPGRIRFPTYEDAVKVERKPEPIANIIYMVGRKLLDPQPGDGWKFRGRGLIGLTFKDEYLRASKAIYNDDRLVQNPDLVATDRTTAILTACYFFKRNNMNPWADKQDWGNCRSIVNAGSPGKDPKIIHGYESGVKFQQDAYNVLKG